MRGEVWLQWSTVSVIVPCGGGGGGLQLFLQVTQ